MTWEIAGYLSENQRLSMSQHRIINDEKRKMWSMCFRQTPSSRPMVLRQPEVLPSHQERLFWAKWEYRAGRTRIWEFPYCMSERESRKWENSNTKHSRCCRGVNTAATKRGGGTARAAAVA